MLKEESRTKQTCPLCGSIYFDTPAISRTDHKTSICPDCGTRQALETIGVSKEEQDKIIDIIHQHLNR